MTNANNPTPVLLTQASNLVASHPSIETIRRWAAQGVRGVRLESWLIGGRRYTSREAIARFLDQLQHSSDAVSADLGP
jgi:hypothetical protein